MRIRTTRDMKRILKEVSMPEEKHAMLSNLIESAKTYRRLQVVVCNGELTDLQMRREAKLECDMIHYATVLGYDVKFSGDPRGFVVTLTEDYDQVFEQVSDGFKVRTSHKTRDVVGIA